MRVLAAREAMERVGELSAVLMDCVEGGASVSFMAPLTRERADAFWRRVAEGVAASDRLLIVAEDRSTGEIVGTVQVVFAVPENQPHRGDVAKMLVRRSARRQGFGARLMCAAEEAALAAILIPVAFFAPVSGVGKALMIGIVLVVLIVELLNSALEAAVDHASLESHPLAKRAKDMASAAVLIALVAVPIVWLLVLLG